MSERETASEFRLDPQRERDLRYTLQVLRPECDRLTRVMYANVWPWRYRRWRRARAELLAVQQRWQRILDGEEHAP